MARAISAKKGLETSGTSKPSVKVFLPVKAEAITLGWKSKRSIIALTALLVSALILPLPLITFETVAIETPASLAISYIVAFITDSSSVHGIIYSNGKFKDRHLHLHYACDGFRLQLLYKKLIRILL